jgi:hypothetical protein
MSTNKEASNKNKQTSYPGFGRGTKSSDVKPKKDQPQVGHTKGFQKQNQKRNQNKEQTNAAPSKKVIESEQKSILQVTFTVLR